MRISRIANILFFLLLLNILVGKQRNFTTHISNKKQKFIIKLYIQSSIIKLFHLSLNFIQKSISREIESLLQLELGAVQRGQRQVCTGEYRSLSVHAYCLRVCEGEQRGRDRALRMER